MPIGGHISALEEDPGQRDQIVVKVDGRIAARITPRAASALGLAEGMTVTAKLAAGLEEANGLNAAVRRAARRLNRRALSCAETASYLENQGFEPHVVVRAVEYLQRLGVLDDERLGLALIEEARTRRGAGPALLQRKLTQRRINTSAIASLIEASTPKEGDIDLARNLARRRLATMGGLDTTTQRRRLYGFLARRGFDEDTVQSIVEEMTESAE